MTDRAGIPFEASRRMRWMDRFVFFNSSGSNYYVIVQADPALSDPPIGDCRRFLPPESVIPG